MQNTKNEIVCFEDYIQSNHYVLDIAGDDLQRYLWCGLMEKKSMYVHAGILEWLGFEGEPKNQKQNYKSLLDRNDIPYEEIFYSDPRVQNYNLILQELERGDHHTKNKKFLILDVDNFKESIMMLNTKCSKRVRKYYLHLEKAVWEYQKYMIVMKDNQLQNERSEGKIYKERLRKSFEFNQATKHVYPKEYIYICTTKKYQLQNKFKVGGVSSFELLKARLSQYNSGESDSNIHFYIFAENTVSYKVIEHTVKSLLLGFRENQSSEFYNIHYYWLEKFIKDILEGNSIFATYINTNRDQIVLDTLEKEPLIVSPLHIEQVCAIKYSSRNSTRSKSFEPKILQWIEDGLTSFESSDNILKRKEFENHLTSLYPSLKLDGIKRDVWSLTKQIGFKLKPEHVYKY